MNENSLKKILILAANPKNSTPLRLDQEVRDIDEGLTRAKQRDRFAMEQKWAVRPRDVQRAILDLAPQIVHFSGHGVGEGGLALEDETGQAKLVSTQAIAGLFELFADQIECVLLNACYSEVQAKAIAQHIPYVIGMNQAVGDAAAREFAVGFYDALGAGRDIEFAYKFACNSIQMAGIPEDLTPVLLKKENSQPQRPPIEPRLVTPPLPVPRPLLDLDVPEGTIPIESLLYVDRPPIEARCYEAIVDPGALIRIKAPRQMGKSSLMLRILNHAIEQGTQTAWLNFQLVDRESLSSLDLLFLQWFCNSITQELNLDDRLADYWKGTFSPKNKCTNYFQRYLLP